MGVGGATASAALPADAFAKLNCPTCVATAAFGSQGAADGQFAHPRGLTFDQAGNLVVADSQNARILTMTTTGSLVNQFGSFGDADKGAAPGGTFKEPWDMAIGKDGSVYVADTWNHRVEVFDSNHQFVRMWGHFEQVQPGQPGAVDGFWGPRAIVVDDQNRVYVADTGNKRVRVYDNTGKFLYNIGSAGGGQGQLNEPVGLAIDPKSQHLFVADTWNHRVEVFDLSGNFVSSWAVSNWNGPNEDTGNRPYLALDPTGTRLFVTEPDVSRVLVWDVSSLNAQGGATPLLMFGAKGGPDLNHFDVLGGIAVDNNGNLFLADAGSGRILRFEIAKLPGAAVVAPPVIAPPVIATELATQPVSGPRGSF
jgi:DNA-binding beta-propeller fold protein YncE